MVSLCERKPSHGEATRRSARRLCLRLISLLTNVFTVIIYHIVNGSGKTVSLIHVLSTFKKVAKRHGINFDYRYIDLTSPKTYFGALNEVAIALDGTNRKYRKGIPIEFMQGKIASAIADYKGFLALLIDEADNIRPNPDALLTYLGKTLPRKVSCRLILILLTNRLDWEKTLDPRILSFLKKTDIIFEPYDALDLLEILKLRAEKALRKDKVSLTALKKMAAYASRETGDARKAVELLTKAVRIAEETTGFLGEKEVDIAESRLEVDKTTNSLMHWRPSNGWRFRPVIVPLKADHEKRRAERLMRSILASVRNKTIVP